MDLPNLTKYHQYLLQIQLHKNQLNPNKLGHWSQQKDEDIESVTASPSPSGEQTQLVIERLWRALTAPSPPPLPHAAQGSVFPGPDSLGRILKILALRQPVGLVHSSPRVRVCAQPNREAHSSPVWQRARVGA